MFLKLRLVFFYKEVYCLYVRIKFEMKYYYNIFFNGWIVLILIRWLGFFGEEFWDIMRFKGKFV